MIRHTISQCKYLYNNHNASKEVAKKQKVENKNFEKLHSNLDKGKVHKGKTLPPDDTMQHIPQQTKQHEVAQIKSQPVLQHLTNDIVQSKIVVDEDPLSS